MTTESYFSPSTSFSPGEIVAAEIVVLRNDREFGVRILRQRIACIEPRLVAERRLHADGGLRELRDVGEFRGAGGQEQLRDILALQIFGDRGVMGGADRGEDQRDLVALHQPARLLHRLRRRVAVVERDQVDLAAIDAAALVDHLEIADLALAERAERRHRPAIGHGLADLDFGCGDAAHFGGGCGQRQQATAPARQILRANASILPPLCRALDRWPRQARFSRRSLVAQTCHGAPMDAIPNDYEPMRLGIKKRGVSAAFLVQDAIPLTPAAAAPGRGPDRGAGATCRPAAPPRHAAWSAPAPICGSASCP